MDEVVELGPLDQGEGEEGAAHDPGLPRSGKSALLASRCRCNLDRGEDGGDGLVCISKGISE